MASGDARDHIAREVAKTVEWATQHKHLPSERDFRRDQNLPGALTLSRAGGVDAFLQLVQEEIDRRAGLNRPASAGEPVFKERRRVLPSAAQVRRARATKGGRPRRVSGDLELGPEHRLFVTLLESVLGTDSLTDRPGLSISSQSRYLTGEDLPPTRRRVRELVKAFGALEKEPEILTAWYAAMAVHHRERVARIGNVHLHPFVRIGLLLSMRRELIPLSRKEISEISQIAQSAVKELEEGRNFNATTVKERIEAVMSAYEIGTDDRRFVYSMLAQERVFADVVEKNNLNPTAPAYVQLAIIARRAHSGVDAKNAAARAHLGAHRLKEIDNGAGRPDSVRQFFEAWPIDPDELQHVENLLASQSETDPGMERSETVPGAKPIDSYGQGRSR